jgi:hypothetical protein
MKTRANSTQSIRIRNLEAELSRLLSENIALRGQIIDLQEQLEGSRSVDVIDHVNKVKGKLEQKLAELGLLVNEISAAEPRRRRISLAKLKRARRESSGKSIGDGNQKNSFTTSDAVANQEGRLPPILEDKCYPRTTLEFVCRLYQSQ